MKDTKVNVEIYGNTYTLRSSGDPEGVLNIGSYVDGKMSDFEKRMASPRLPGDWLFMDSNQGWQMFFSNHLPVVENGTPTPYPGYAALAGTLTSTGGAHTAVHIYWGETDGDTNKTDWAHTNIFSDYKVEGVPFATNTGAGLVYGVQYYFRCYASNVNGEAWAPSTTATLPSMKGSVNSSTR